MTVIFKFVNDSMIGTVTLLGRLLMVILSGRTQATILEGVGGSDGVKLGLTALEVGFRGGVVTPISLTRS